MHKIMSASFLSLLFLITVQKSALANASDISGAIAVGTGYAGIYAAPTNGMIVQGYAGIGTAAPIAKLHVYGVNVLLDNAASTYRTYQIETAETPRWQFGANNTAETGSDVGSDFYIQKGTDAGSWGAVPFLIQRGSGNVGIGTTAPAYVLDVNGGSSFPGARLTGSSTDTGIYIDNTTAAGRNWLLESDGTSTGAELGPGSFTIHDVIGGDRFAIGTSGNAWFGGSVGIGTATPAQTLDVSGNTLVEGLHTLYMGADLDLTGDNINLQIGSSDDEFAFNYVGKSNAWINLYNGSGTSKVLLHPGGSSYFLGGKVGIGTATPGYLLHLYTTSTGAVAEFQNSSGACTHTPSSSGETVSCSSDLRLKTDVRDSPSALPWLAGIKVRDYKIKSTGQTATGVIAQEMLSTNPEMVHTDTTSYYKVDEPNPWKLVKAMQELTIENRKLREFYIAQEDSLNDLRKDFEEYKSRHP